jgi:hypothetical protein
MASEKMLRRLIFISGMKGWCVTALAGLSILVSLLMGSWSDVTMSLAITVLGYMELKGRQFQPVDRHYEYNRYCLINHLCLSQYFQEFSQ